jgi:hypothetical protein
VAEFDLSAEQRQRLVVTSGIRSVHAAAKATEAAAAEAA